MRDLRITIELTTSRPPDISDGSPQREEVISTSSMLSGIQHAIIDECMNSQDVIGEIWTKLTIVRGAR